MYRNLLVCASLCSLYGCLFAPPGTPSILQTAVTGEWRGTFASSWAEEPLTATLENLDSSQSISGSFALESQRATGTIYGAMETRREIPDHGNFWGTLSISYATPTGETCRATGQFAGSGGEQLVTFQSVGGGGFTIGDCPDPPMNVRITLRRR
jgi:hypothetical protein